MDSKLLRSRSGQVMAVLAIVFSAIGVVALSTEPLPLLVTKIWIYIWFGYCAWLVFWNPSVRVSDSEVVVDNIFRTSRLNWSAIRRIDTKYSLSLETERGVFRAWAAPAPSRYAGFMANRSEAEHLPESSFIGEGLVRPGDLTTSDSGVAAYVIRQNWERFRDLNQLDKKAEIESRLVPSRIVVFVVLSVAAAVGFTF
ncbi:unannotated protein [freshwater metagenome]|uniref:Unannotated protein n=1 Tax=freshwater metagenome TaxID=449393 RepID=A0A6J7FIB2_9ZZZZ|nr:hypothetical protein [Actinomycetota bacterium]